MCKQSQSIHIFIEILIDNLFPYSLNTPCLPKMPDKHKVVVHIIYIYPYDVQVSHVGWPIKHCNITVSKPLGSGFGTVGSRGGTVHVFIPNRRGTGNLGSVHEALQRIQAIHPKSRRGSVHSL